MLLPQGELQQQSNVPQTVEEAAVPLRAQLAALEEQHAGMALAVGEVQGAVAGVAAIGAETEAAVNALWVSGRCIGECTGQVHPTLDSV